MRISDRIQTEYLKSRKIPDFLEAIKQKNVEVVIDIRWWFLYPDYFRPNNLQNELRKAGIVFIPFNALGNPSNLRKQAGEDFNLAKKLYLKYIENRIELGNLEHLIDSGDETFCLICYCKTLDERKCHRFWLREKIINDLTKFEGRQTAGFPTPREKTPKAPHLQQSPHQPKSRKFV